MRVLFDVIQCLLLYYMIITLIHSVNSLDTPYPTTPNAKPNILFILIDDLGWNDIGFHNSTDYSTPYIDNLANHEGLQLNNYYVQSLCTPSRAALLSGRYPFKTGMQHSNINNTQPYGLPLKYNLISQDLRDKANYSTHMIGKWGIGYFNIKYTPTYRGFDTFIGFYNDKEDYFTHTIQYNGTNAIDFRNGTDPYDYSGYSTYLYGNETLDILRKRYNKTKPFFIYLSFQALHSPLQVPLNADDVFIDSINNPQRRIKAAMATILDNTIHQIVNVLKNELNIWNNTLLIMSTDNGASLEKFGSNYPLRGSKGTLWQGGVRGTAFISGGYLNSSRYGEITNELIHITDWYPTLCDIAGITATNESDLDGISFFNVIQNETAKSFRKEVILNIDIADCHNDDNLCGSLIHGDMKLISGYQPNWISNTCQSGWCSGIDSNYSHLSLNNNKTTVKCGNDEYPADIMNDIYSSCPFNDEPCLFNITADPCEYTNIRATHFQTFLDLLEKLTSYRDSVDAVYPLNLLNPEEMIDLDSGYWGSWKNSSEMNTNTNIPTKLPSLQPTLEPTLEPSKSIPTTPPTVVPSFIPTAEPTVPTLFPTETPTLEPTIEPTMEPIKEIATKKPIKQKTSPFMAVMYVTMIIISIVIFGCVGLCIVYKKRIHNKDKKRHLRLQESVKHIELTTKLEGGGEDLLLMDD